MFTDLEQHSVKCKNLSKCLRMTFVNNVVNVDFWNITANVVRSNMVLTGKLSFMFLYNSLCNTVPENTIT